MRHLWADCTCMLLTCLCFCLLLSRSSYVHVSSFKAADGSIKDSSQLTASASLGSLAAVSGQAVAIVSSNDQQLCTLLINPEGEAAGSGVVCQAFSELSTDFASNWPSSSQLQLLPAGAGRFSLTVGQGTLRALGTLADTQHASKTLNAAYSVHLSEISSMYLVSLLPVCVLDQALPTSSGVGYTSHS